MQKAKDFTAQEKLEEARISLMSASEIKPNDAGVYFQLAEILVRQQHFDRAVENYRTAINYDPNHHDARLHLATLLLGGREFELAEDQTKKILEKNPDDNEALLIQANIEAGSPRKNYKGASDIFHKILAKDEKSVGAISGLAGIALSQGNLKEAEEGFLKALKIDEKNGPLRMVLADLYSRQGRLDEAQELVERLIKDNPTNSGLRYGFGEFLLKRGMADQATTQYEEILKTEPLRHEARDRMYDMYLTRQDVGKAKELTADLVKLAPQDPGTSYFQGRDAELENKLDQALELYLKGITGLTNFAPIFRRAGLIELSKGTTDVALQHLNQAVAIDSGDIGARLALARDALAKKNYSGATEHVNKVLERFPRQLGANVLRADIALLQGDTELARKVYQYLMDTFPNSPTGYFKLGLLEEKNKNFDKAVELYRKTLAFDSDILLPAQRLAGLMVMKLGVDKTIDEVKVLLEKSEKSKPEFKLLLGTLTLSNGSDPKRFDIARQLFQDALNGRPALIGAYFALGAIDAQQGDLESAAKNYEKLIAQSPQHVPSYMLLAMAKERQGKFSEAADVYRKVLSLSPRFGPAANNLAWLLCDELNGDLDEALKLAQLAKEVLPSEGSVTDTLGWIHLKRGSAQVALTFLEEAVELEHKAGDGKRVNPEILLHLARAQEATGDKKSAKDTISEAIQQAGEKHPLLQTLQEFQQKLG